MVEEYEPIKLLWVTNGHSEAEVLDNHKSHLVQIKYNTMGQILGTILSVFDVALGGWGRRSMARKRNCKALWFSDTAIRSVPRCSLHQRLFDVSVQSHHIKPLLHIVK